MSDHSDFSPYLNVRSSFGGTLRADGQRLAFLNNTSGTAQVWTVDAPGRWPQQRTFHANRVTFVSYAPQGPQLLFGMDEGGNEQDQLYLTDDDGLTLLALTDDPRVKHTAARWSHDGARIAFTATRENPTDFTPYVMDVRSRDTRALYALGGYNSVAAWLPGDAAVIVWHADGPFEHALHRVNVATGEAQRLTDSARPARYEAVRALPDGSGLLLLSDLDRDFLNVARLDFASGALTFLSDRPWDEEGVAVTADGRTLAVSWNEEGFSHLECLDLGTGARRPVSGLPDGVLSGPTLGRDGGTFLVTAEAPNEAMNVWAVDASAATATRWTDSTLGGVPRAALAQPEVVHFEGFDGLRVPALYLRPTARGDGPHAVVMIVHGGPESQSRPIFNPVAQYLVAQGYAVLLPNVRGSTGYGKAYSHLDDVRLRMNSVADLQAAHAWLVREGRADPARIAIYGGSYGGFMVLSALTTYPELWAAGVDLVGIASFATFLEHTSAYRRRMREAEYGSLEHDRAFLHDISPLTHIDRITAPLMVIHGANDPRVPVGEAEQVVAALQARGVPVAYLRYPDEGHGLVKLHNRLDAYPKVAAFLAEHLGRGPRGAS